MKLTTMLRRRHGSHGEAIPGESQLLQAPAATAGMQAAVAATIQTTPVQGCGADGSPLVRDSLGVRPATWGEIYEHRAEYEAMGIDIGRRWEAACGPLGIAAAPDITFAGGWDTQAEREEVAAIFGQRQPGDPVVPTLAEIQAMAAEQAAIEAVESRRIALEERDRTTSDLRPARPYTTPATSDDPTLELRPVYAPPSSAVECYSRMTRVLYPPPVDGSREQWAAALRQVGEATGTRTRWESENAWPGRTLSLAPLTVWSVKPAVQHTPLLALPAGSEAAA